MDKKMKLCRDMSDAMSVLSPKDRLSCGFVAARAIHRALRPTSKKKIVESNRRFRVECSPIGEFRIFRLVAKSLK